jgi:multisubunit Na+/H+ antiporter MnhF subunit
MTVWEVCAVVLAGTMLPCIGVCMFAGAAAALAALEVLGTVTTTVLMILAEAFNRQPFIDLALVLAFLSIIGALAFARLMEQDL